MKINRVIFLHLSWLCSSDSYEVASWSSEWWDIKLKPLAHPTTHNNNKPSSDGVSLSINYPSEGSVVRYIAEWGDIVPMINIELFEGELANLIRSNVTNWNLCMSVNSKFHSCSPLDHSVAVPQLHLDTRLGYHTLRVWLADRGQGRGEQNPVSSSSAVTSSRFSTHQSLLGTGCRSIANWFLVSAPSNNNKNKLWKIWWRDMVRKWEELIENERDGDQPLEALWRYFEMDCILTNIREKQSQIDTEIMNLAAFPVGNNGDSKTPHEFLDKAVNFDQLKDDHAWMLKLKGEGVPALEEYDHFIEAKKKTIQNRYDIVEVPRIIWMFWYQGEDDASLRERDRICIHGWRRLNLNWEVRFLDAESAKTWAPDVFSLWNTGTPDGVLVQHMADVLRVYLLAYYGGVWADVSVLPLEPLDSFLPLALDAESKSPRSFFAYAFPDPMLSYEVSLIPTFMFES